MSDPVALAPRPCASPEEEPALAPAGRPAPSAHKRKMAEEPHRKNGKKVCLTAAEYKAVFAFPSADAKAAQVRASESHIKRAEVLDAALRLGGHPLIVRIHDAIQHWVSGDFFFRVTCDDGGYLDDIHPNSAISVSLRDAGYTVRIGTSTYVHRFFEVSKHLS